MTATTKTPLFILCSIVLALARGVTDPPPAPRWYYGVMHDINQVEMYAYNFGPIAADLFGGWDPGCWWPKGSDHAYIFGAGPWFGAVNMLANDTFVTTGYGSYYWTEMLPGTKDVAWNSEDAIIYQYPGNWPAPQEIFYDAPQGLFSNQDSWCAFNDLDPEAHTPGDKGPIGIQTYQTVYAWDIGGLEDAIFVKYEMKNVTDSTLSLCIFGFFMDGDIGNEGYNVANDITRGIVRKYYNINGQTMLIDNFAYQWQEEYESGWDTVPGVFGVDLLQSPWDLQEDHDKDFDGIPDQYERDSVYFYNNLPQELWDADFDGQPDWRDPSQIPQLGITAMKSSKPNSSPDNDFERYMFLAGYDYETGSYEPWDTATSTPRDQRFLQCTGPFELLPESSQVFIVALMFADWYNLYGTPDTAIVTIDNFCQYVFDHNWLLPRPPSSPILTCVPGDAEITLIWDSGPEHEADTYFQLVGTNPNSPVYDPFYRQYDFEGYRIWKSYAPEDSTWFKLASCDLFNEITFYDTLSIPGDTLVADNRGLRHSHIDRDVRNGFTYFYAVSSFDQNYTKTTDSTFKILRLESKPQLVPGTPRRDPVNYVPGSFSLEQLCGNERLFEQIGVEITYPLDMTSDVQHVVFGDLDWTWFYSYDSSHVKVDSIVAPVISSYVTDDPNISSDSAHIALPPRAPVDFEHMFKTLHGINVTMQFLRDSLPTSEPLFEKVETHGTYPDTLIFPVPPGPHAEHWIFCGYRGNDYDIHWVIAPGGGLSLHVTDIHTGTDIPYKPYFPDSSHQYDTLALGWCFLSLRQASDTVITNGQNPQALWNTRWIYICGGLLTVKGGGHLLPGDPLPSPGDKCLIHARNDFYPMVVNAAFAITPTPAYFDTIHQITAMNVKVVPNPYLVHNEWQYTFEQRRIKFINLPAECTIRIFSISGELLRVIKHHHTTVNGVKNDAGGDEWWDMLSDTRNRVVSGVYLFHVHSETGEQTGKFVIVR
ncbi:T9SS type A sorting domain-containing protein [candidate division WOR-3 bacterium]|nr:T9SS type A sorting domain-containing protein [candidate division WOR-3 bacterium]